MSGVFKKSSRPYWLTKEIIDSLENSKVSEELQLQIYSSLTEDLARLLANNPKVPIDIRRGIRVFVDGIKEQRGDRDVMLDGAKMRSRLSKIGEHRENMKLRMQEFRLKEKESDVNIEYKKAQTKLITDKDSDKMDKNIIVNLINKFRKKDVKNSEDESP